MKIFLDSIGCRLNQSEIETIAARLRRAGHVIVADASEAEFAIINTCSVTARADADSRKKIRQMGKNQGIRIIATGCYATIDPEAIHQLPAVEQIVKNSQKEFIAELFNDENQTKTSEIFKRLPIPGKKRRTRAFIKIQDGCDNFCTFCVTRIARGKSVSRPFEEILQDVRMAVAGDVREIVLTGVNIGSFGKDFSKNFSLADLIKSLIQNEEQFRLRLSSIEPWDVDDTLIDVLNHERVCRHLHIPLQSGSDAVLKRMGRNICTADYAFLLEKLRKQIQDIAITTDIIVGFPGESREQFNSGKSFIEKMEFSGGHVFSYSPRPLTPAISFPDRVPEKEIKTRSQSMRNTIQFSSQAYRKKILGSCVQVLWEKEKRKENGWQLRGFSDNYIRVESFSEQNLYNQFSNVILLTVHEDGITGKLI